MKHKKIITLCIILALSLSGFLFYYLNSDPYKYSKASRLLHEGKNDEALLLYDELGEYEDASSIASETRYNMAFNLLNKGNYLEAIEMYEQVGDYKYALHLIDSCYYKYAHQLFLEKKYDEADIYFSKISDNYESRYPHFRKLEDATEYIINQALLAEEKIILHIGDLDTPSLDDEMKLHFTYLSQTNVAGADWIKDDKIMIIEPTVYPGVKIAAYHKQNRTHELTQKETELYQKALQLVEQAKQESSTTFEIEAWINNWLCVNSIEIYEYTYENDGDVIPIECTAFVPLMHGRADCFGYSDAFYLLASLCDFNVRLMFGSTTFDEHTHIWNAIELDNQWYYVDITWNDDDDSRFEPDFTYLNFVESSCDYHLCYDFARICETAETVSPEFDYYEINNCSFNTLAEAAKYAINQRLSYNQKEVILRVKQHGLTPDHLIDAIKAQAKNYQGSFAVKSTEAKNDTYYVVYWTSLYR